MSRKAHLLFSILLTIATTTLFINALWETGSNRAGCFGVGCIALIVTGFVTVFGEDL